MDLKPFLALLFKTFYPLAPFNTRICKKPYCHFSKRGKMS
ncbi:hypothetical protein HPCPY6271_1290 [Helicobacter pylori CPY6271]|nr:hypothetical protein HPCPY6271_1290 [Helicobacter pylori CPY6271]